MMSTTRSTTDNDNNDKLKRLTLNISSTVLDTAFSNLVSQGCFGAVCRIPYDGAMYAAKYQNFDSDTQYKVEQFQSECLLHSKLHHPNIVRMLGVCYHSDNLDQPIKVMELIELSLSLVVHSGFEFPMYVKLSVMQDVSRGLDYLHTRNPPIVHSYLCLQVVLLTVNLVAKIGGFTFSVEMVPGKKRLPTHPVGDILESSLYCGPPFDIYSFGYMICKMLIKQRFYGVHTRLVDEATGKSYTAHINIGRYHCVSQISNPSLKELVTNCVSDNPDLRPSASVT